MTTRQSARFGDTTIEYALRRSERRKKTVQITVDSDGVQVAAPCAMPDDDVQAMVRKRAPWILRHVSRRTLEAAPKRFVSGETLPYLGRNVRLVVDSADVRSPEVRFDHWRFRVSVPPWLAGDERRDAIRRAVIGWYRARAEDRLPSRVAFWCPHLGQREPRRVLIRDQHHRWGSCAPDGTLRFNWQLVMAPPALIDYVVVHELAHLTEAGHSQRFWGLVGRVMPDYKGRRARLADAGLWLPV